MNNTIFSMTILLAYLVKLFIQPASLQDCVVVALLVSIYGFLNHLDFKKEKNASDKYKDKVEQDIALLKSELEQFKSKLGAFSIASTSRNSLNGR